MNISIKKAGLTVMAAALLTISMASNAAAEPAHGGPTFSMVDRQDVSQLWINPGFETLHFNSSAGLNGNNLGIGAEYRFSTVSSLTAGTFNNSDRRHSKYAGIYYQPVAFYGVHLGVVAGAFDGYPKMRNGGWFPAVIPVATIEGDRIGLNVAIIPSYKDRLYGGISFQLKLRAF